MKITIEVNEETGDLQLSADKQGIPVPVISWYLRKAEDALFNPPAAVAASVVAAPAGALRKLPPHNGAEMR